jgi:hypothetical protein
MASYDKYTGNQQGNATNFGLFNRILRSLSTMFGGLEYNDMRIRNSYSIGVHEETTDVLYQPNSSNMYDLFTKKTIARFLDKKSIAYLDRTYLDKRKILRQYSIKDEIKDFITQVADECIIYDDNNRFCYVRDLPDSFGQTLKQKYQENFSRLLTTFNFHEGQVAWNYIKNLLIDGYISYEIVYDDKQKNIIDLAPMDPITLIVATDPNTNTMIWIQHPDNPALRRILLDSQVIYISYSNNNEYGETSYVENLIRPFNQLKMIEQARLLYNINQASIYKKFVIPVGGLTRSQAEQQVYELMSEYHDDVQWDERMGTVSINGQTNIPFSKDFWFPEGDAGTPNVEILQLTQVELNEDVVLQWFSKILKRASKLPFQRFDEDNGGGSYAYDSSAAITRDEVKFKNFINRVRTIFKEIVVKPLKIQMILDFPELKDNVDFNDAIRLEFISDTLFEEWRYLKNLSERANIASTLSSSLMDSEGKAILAPEWIIRHIMKFSDADIEENNKYKALERMRLGGGEGGPPEGGGFGGGGEAFGGGGAFGGEEFGGGGGAQFGGEQFGGAQAGGGGAQFGGAQAGGGGAQAGGAQAGGGGAPPSQQAGGGAPTQETSF